MRFILDPPQMKFDGDIILDLSLNEQNSASATNKAPRAWNMVKPLKRKIFNWECTLESKGVESSASMKRLEVGQCQAHLCVIESYSFS